MDTEFARTFLAVADAGSFIAAAKGLHVTQSTVSGRIQALEEQLGCRLFTRDRSGAALTGAGRRFYKYAVLLVQAVEQAREEMALPQSSPARLTIGARASLWDGLLIDWIAELRRAAPDISFHARVGLERDLMQEMTDGPVDLAVMYAPQARAHLEMLRLTEEPLVLVASACAGEQSPYIRVDWSPDFVAQHKAYFPEPTEPSLAVNIGWLGLHYLLDHGGSGYFPLRLVSRLIAERRLTRVAAAPEFLLPVWLVYRKHRDKKLMRSLIASLQRHLQLACQEGWASAGCLGVSPRDGAAGPL